MSFEKLGVSEAIVKGLKEIEILEPTLIQEKAIPAVIEGKDVVGMSKTGSGKTAAFGIPTLERVKKGEGVQALILTPTRELAVQISRELEKFGKYTDISMVTVYGGVAIDPQVRKIKTSEIVVGTPGRVLDHLERKSLKLSHLKVFVLDEADKMVDMGFIDDMRRILNYTADDRQILLFGATLSSEINALKRDYMNDPIVAEAESHVKEDFLEQFYYNIPQFEKFSLLVHLLKKEEINRAIIFCSTRATVDVLTRNLQKQKIRSESIHGKMSQNRRQRVIDAFNDGKYKILIASAVAARGLDIKGVSHVFNYDLPKDPQEYIHRVGRTARAGTYGKAITLLSQRDHECFAAIMNRYPITVQKLEVEQFEKLRFDARQERGRKGFRSQGHNRRRSSDNYRRDKPREVKVDYGWQG